MNRFLGKGLGCLHLEGHPSDPVRLRAVVGQHQRDRMNGIVADVVPSRAAGITFSSELGNRSARRVKKLKDQAIFLERGGRTYHRRCCYPVCELFTTVAKEPSHHPVRL